MLERKDEIRGNCSDQHLCQINAELQSKNFIFYLNLTIHANNSEYNYTNFICKDNTTMIACENDTKSNNNTIQIFIVNNNQSKQIKINSKDAEQTFNLFNVQYTTNENEFYTEFRTFSLIWGFVESLICIIHFLTNWNTIFMKKFCPFQGYISSVIDLSLLSKFIDMYYYTAFTMKIKNIKHLFWVAYILCWIRANVMFVYTSGFEYSGQILMYNICHFPQFQIFFLMLGWIPQICYNIRYDQAYFPDTSAMFLILSYKAFFLIYGSFYSKRIFDYGTPLINTLILIVYFVTTVILYLQSKYGSRFIFKKSNRYDYFAHRPPQGTECTICYAVIGDSERCVTTKCGHSFHYDCLNEWLRINQVCPLCRSSISDFPLNS